MTSTRELRRWQDEALDKWIAEGSRGIVSVVTGAGKTIFALACIERIKASTTLIVVPTSALSDQWWEETASYFRWRLDDVNIVTGSNAVRVGTINIAVINTAAKLARKRKLPECFLIVDECHRAASPSFREILSINTFATLGLSATPERQYDEGLSDLLIPALGPIVYEYNYSDAKADSVITPFVLTNIIFELEKERQQEYDKLTRAIARSIHQHGVEGDKTISLLLRRARILNLSERRIVLALKLVAAHRSNRTLVFHEDIEACDVITSVLHANDIRVWCLSFEAPDSSAGGGFVTLPVWRSSGAGYVPRAR